jgi:hypothetical protein
MTPHEQSLELFELETRVTRSIIVFDPRYVFAQHVFSRHGALHRNGRFECVPEVGHHYLAFVSKTCELLHMVNNFISG